MKQWVSYNVSEIKYCDTITINILKYVKKVNV